MYVTGVNSIVSMARGLILRSIKNNKKESFWYCEGDCGCFL